MADPARALPSIVIVDDEPDQLLVTRKMLDRAGVKHPIVELTGGPEAISYLSAWCSAHGPPEKNLPAVVFLELKLRVTDGFAVLGWIRSKLALHNVKVLVLTSSDDPDDVKQCTILGAHAYLVKHPHPIVISSTLRQVFGEKPPEGVAAVEHRAGD